MIPLALAQRFLGEVQGSDPFSLLGLTPESCNPARIDEALRIRIARTYAQTDGNSEEAEKVRQAIRAAATALRDPTRRPQLAAEFARSTHGQRSNGLRVRANHELTQFDCEVMAILVASGGWNPLSRARLVVLARAHGITARGLIKVISGLNEYARTGGPRLAMSQIASAQPHLREAADDERGTLHQIAQVTHALVEKFTPELREQNARTTITLSAFFGMVAVLASIAVWYLLVTPMFEPAALTQRDSPSTEQVAPIIPDAEGDKSEDEAERERVNVSREPIRFDSWPTFRAALPDEFAEAQRRARELPDELDALSRTLMVSEDASEAVFHRWEAIVNDISTAWVIIDPALRREIEQGIVDVLFIASDSFPTLDRLMRAIQPGAWDRADPLATWRGAWRVGMLAGLARSRLLPPAIVDQAATHLRMSMSWVEGEQKSDEPAAVRAAWLDAMSTRIASDWEDEHALTHWECWLVARRDGADDESFRRAVGKAIALVLGTVDHTAEQHTAEDLQVRVLGRLIESLDFAQSPATKSRLLAMFDDSAVSSESLYLLTSLLAHASDPAWFDNGLVVPPNADDALRRRLADRVESAWPDLSEIEKRFHLAAAGLTVDSHVIEQWNELRTRIDAFDHRGIDEGLMLAIVLQSRLNEAAVHLAEDAPGRAERALVAIESLLEDENRARTGGRGTTTDPHGRAGSGRASAEGESRTGPDDDRWARRYRDAGRAVEERLELLAELRRRSGSDLTEDASSVLVREVYRGGPREVREQAQAILLDRFSRGSNVALEMLDQFVDVARSPVTGEMISRYTGRTLPHVRSGDWRRLARQALVEHAIELHFPDRPAIDVLAEELVEAVRNQTAALVEDHEAVSQPTRPEDAAAQLYMAWRDRARDVEPPSRAIPASVAGIAQRHETRRRFAHHTIQDYLAHQISVLELSAYVAAAQQPVLGPAVESLLTESARNRQDVSHVLEQVLFVEQAMTSLWNLRFDPEVQDRFSSAEFAEARGAHDARHDSEAEARSSADEQRVPDRWAARLEALEPHEPEAYFVLAEDVADRGASPEEKALARRLFGLAGVIDREQFGAGAAFALAELAERTTQRERWHALARLLDPATLSDRRESRAFGEAMRFSDEVALAAAYAFSAYRLGDGRELRNRLDGSGGTLLEQLGDALPGGTERMLEDTRDRRSGRISVGALRLERLLRVEHALLSDENRLWSGVLRLDGQATLLEVDPMRLEEMFGVDADRPYFRSGQWVERALPVR